MKDTIISFLLTTLLLLTLFSLDLWLFFLEGRQLFFLVLALFIAALFSQPNRTGLIIGCGLLLMCESLVVNGALWLPLLLTLPAVLIITVFRPYIYPHTLHPSIATGVCIAATQFLNASFLSQQLIFNDALIITFLINLLIAGFFFLRLRKIYFLMSNA